MAASAAVGPVGGGPTNGDRPGSSNMDIGGSLGLAYKQSQIEKMQSVITKFRLLVERGKANRMMTQWGQRLYEIVIESTGSDEFKSISILEFFETEFAHLWFYCKYVALICELYEEFGQANRSNFGSYRVELIVMLFDRIVDLENFEVIMSVLNAEEQASIYARIGKFISLYVTLSLTTIYLSLYSLSLSLSLSSLSSSPHP